MHCPKKFKAEKCLKKHTKETHDESNNCDVCGYGFNTEKQLMRHIKKVHEAEIVCPKCGKVFKNKRSFRKHSKNICMKDAEDSEDGIIQKGLKRALVEYEGTSDSEISDSELLEKRGQNVKKVKLLLKCPDCPKTYTSSRGLRGHKKKFHRNPLMDPANSAIINTVVVIDGNKYVVEAEENIQVTVETYAE